MGITCGDGRVYVPAGVREARVQIEIQLVARVLGPHAARYRRRPR
jgi:prolyl-tRNA editing enzyme YbaK/EbsC (Cys-tRNA(Pro) deacylase)